MAESLGALVGWTAQDMGHRVALRLECVKNAPPHGRDDVHVHLLMLDKSQALQLGHFLYTVAGQSPPAPRKAGWFTRLLRMSR